VSDWPDFSWATGPGSGGYSVPFSMTLSVPDGCAECKQPFAEDEERVCILFAGSAWKNGVAVLKDGAEMYRWAAFHDACAPKRDEAAA